MSNATQATQDQMAELLRECEVRRPGITAIYNDLRERYPVWTVHRCYVEAKLRWHSEQKAP